MEMNLNYRGTYAENKLVREMTRIIRENEENAKRQNQTGKVFTKNYQAVSRDGDTLEINRDCYIKYQQKRQDRE